MKSLLLALLILPTMAFAENAAPTSPPVSPKESVASKLESTVISFLDATQNAGNKLSDAAGKVIDFASSEIPIVIKEYLNWHFTSSLFYFSLGVLLSATAVFLIYKFVYKSTELWTEQDPKYQFIDVQRMTNAGGIGITSIIVGCILFLVGMIITTNNLGWIKISIAPRVYLIDQFQHLAK